MTAVAIPIDLARIRSALERLELPEMDLRQLDLSDLDSLRRELGRRLPDVDLQRVLADLDLDRLELPRFDLPKVDLNDLPDLDTLFGRRKPASAVGSGGIVLGLAALLGGLALGGLLAFLLHPEKGPKRRRQLRRRLGRVKRRLLG